MAAGRLLMLGHLRTRGRRQAALAASLATGLLGFFLVAMVLQGAQEGVVRPMQDLVTGDVRVTWGSHEIAGGVSIPDHRVAAAPFADLRGAVVAPRWETSQVTVRPGAPDNWTGGLLIGIDPAIPEEVEGLRPYLTWGGVFAPESLTDPLTGRVYVPLVVGDEAAKRLNLTRSADGRPDFGQVLQVTSGRFERDGDLRPIALEAVVVGTYATGLDTMDRFTAFAPLQEARRLAGDRPGDPTANVLVLHHASLADVEEALAGDPRAQAQDAQAFTYEVMGGFLLMLRVSGALAIALVLGLLGVWLVHDVGTLVTRDGPVVAALRAVGVPFGDLVRGYAGIVLLSVGAAAAVALALAAAVWLLAPPLRFETSTFRLAMPWTLRLEPVLAALAAALGLSALATWGAARRLVRIDVAAALRP